MMEKFKTFWTDDSGQTLAEYAILLALIAIVVIVAVRLLGPTIAAVFTEINTQIGTV